MVKAIFATGNKNKVKEAKEILEGLGIELISMKEAGIESDPEETGSTFAENALIKARAVAKISGCLTLADDSGLVIDYLDGAPGIYSARVMGHDTSYDIKNKALIEKLEGIEGDERSARFVAAIAAVFPDGREFTTEGTMEGIIAKEAQGENGFGYDPILYIKEYGCCSAQLSSEAKNAISHRGKALREMREILLENI